MQAEKSSADTRSGKRDAMLYDPDKAKKSSCCAPLFFTVTLTAEFSLIISSRLKHSVVSAGRNPFFQTYNSFDATNRFKINPAART